MAPDFGIATSSGESGLTEAGILLGSPSYMSPERARNQVPSAPLLAAGPLTPVLVGCLTKDPARRMTVDQVRVGLSRAITGPNPPIIRPAAAPYVDRQPTKVERMYVADLSALAKATRSQGGNAANRPAGNAAAGNAAPGMYRPRPAMAKGPPNWPPPRGSKPQPAQAGPQRPKWRFKRRWVIVPTAVVLVLCVAAVVLLIYALGALEGLMGG